MNHRLRTRLAVVSMILIWPTILSAQETVKPRAGLETVAAKLEAFIDREMKAQRLPAISIALVEGRQVVWSRGFGRASQSQAHASTETVYRVGSVSKLFTDLALMPLVERGELDLDAPVTCYLPGFSPKNPFKTPITLRHLTSHRSGLVRESPVGNYFDPTSPSLADTVASLNTTELVYAPGTRTKYMQRPAAESLVKVHQGLKERGLGLSIHDAYRPWHVTKMFWDATPDSGRGFVADPSKGSKHNRGCAIEPRLSRRDVAPALASRPASPRDGGRRLYRQRGRMVAFRLPRLAEVSDPESDV